MASGDRVVEVLRIMPPGTLMAQPGVRVGGSTPAEGVEYWGFDATTIEYLDFLCMLHGYAGGGLTFSIPWMAASATTGDVVWEIGIRRIADDAEDVDTSQTYDYNAATTDTTASATGEVSYAVCTFTNGADMDSWAVGELAIVRIRRNTGASDTMTGDAQLLSIHGKET